MTFMVLFDTVIVGAVVSFSGVGGLGLTGVTGVGSIGSSPPQDTRSESARNQARKRFSVFILLQDYGNRNLKS